MFQKTAKIQLSVFLSEACIAGLLKPRASRNLSFRISSGSHCARKALRSAGEPAVKS
jgi:hypothetical protein